MLTLQMVDVSETRALLLALGPVPASCHLIMDRTYEGDEMWQPAMNKVWLIGGIFFLAGFFTMHGMSR